MSLHSTLELTAVKTLAALALSTCIVGTAAAYDAPAKQTTPAKIGKKAGTHTQIGNYTLPEKFPVPAPGVKPFTPNTMMDPISPEARKKFFQSALALSPFSVRDLVNIATYKVQAQPGLSYEDVVSSMKQRANKINFKFVGVNSIYKDVEALSGKPTPRVELFNFCDAAVARDLLDYSLEFAIFLPCRIAVVEDANKKIWLTMLDWDVSWISEAPNPNVLPESLVKSATRLRKGLEDIIQAGANGAL